MITNKFYQTDPYSAALKTSVISINYDGENAELVTQDTIFFPTGGGQSCDRGTIFFDGNTVEILNVYEKDDEVVHVISGSDAAILKDCALRSIGRIDGFEIKMILDWNHRFDNMQRHCGEHILSGAVYRLFGGVNKGFHMGEDCITIDISFEDGSGGQSEAGICDAKLQENGKRRKMTWEMAERAELEANRVIWSDAPVTVDHFLSGSDAEKLPLRKKLTLDENISVVTIGDPSCPDDCVACCGTHPSTAGQVGLIKIYKIEPNKGMTRIYFEAGKRAFRQYQSRLNSLYDMSLKLSTGYADINEKYDAQMKHMNEMRLQLRHFRSLAIDSEAKKIMEEMHDGMVRRYDDFSVDDLLNLSKKISASVTGIIALADLNSNTVLLLSDLNTAKSRPDNDTARSAAGKRRGNDDTAHNTAGKYRGDNDAAHDTVHNTAGKRRGNDDTDRDVSGRDCGGIIKTIGKSFGGKGGGKISSGRVFFPDRNSMEAFLSSVLK